MTPVTIKLLNVTSTIHGQHSEHDKALDTALSFFAKGFNFSPRYRRGMWDGKTHLYKFATEKQPFGKFSTGLVNRVFQTLDLQFPEDPIIVEDHRIVPAKQEPLPLKGFDLHDYQQTTVDQAIQCQRGIFRLPTASGKSVLLSAIIGRLNLPTLVITHRAQILDHLKQTAEQALGVEFGVLGTGVKNLRKFNIGMIQTLASCYENQAINKDAKKVIDFIQNDCNCLIIDEVHHAQAKTYTTLTNRAYQAFYRYGLSATSHQDKPEDILIEAGFGKIQVSMASSELVQEKRLAKPYIFFVDYGDVSVNKTEVDVCQDCGSRDLKRFEMSVEKASAISGHQDGDLDSGPTRTAYKCQGCDKVWTPYTDAAIRCVVRNPKRNQAIIDLIVERIRKKKSILVLVTYIEHGEVLLEMLQQRVDSTLVEFVQGATDGKNELLEQLGKKEKLCLIATTVFGEGINIPSLDVVMNTRASASKIDTIQVAGRALRVAKGKWKAIVIDFIDKSEYFAPRSRLRMRLFKKEAEFVVKTLDRTTPSQAQIV